jgi:hypothetical protein
MNGGNMTPGIQRTSTSPETLPLEGTAFVQKPACELARRGQSDDGNVEYNLSATACNARMVGCWRMENA